MTETRDIYVVQTISSEYFNCVLYSIAYNELMYWGETTTVNDLFHRLMK